MILHARSEARAAETRRRLPAAEHVVVGDVATVAAMREVAAQVNALGPVDAVIHNVAIGYTLPRRVETADGLVEFRHTGRPIGDIAQVRAMGAEQSNSSLVLDERIALKVYRRLGPGPNPELEVLRFLTERGFEHIAALRGWYAHSGPLIDATLGIAQEFVSGSTDGGCNDEIAPWMRRAREPQWR